MNKLYFFLAGLFLAGFSSVGYSQYCTPQYSYGCGVGDQIQNFSTSGGSTNITNNGSGCSSGNWAQNLSMVHTTESAGTVSFSVQAGSAYSQGHRIWVDWNQDNDFLDAGEDVWNSGSYSTAAYTGSFNVPATALPGTTRMRVRCQYVAVPAHPCNSTTYGEAEDYTLMILPPVANDAGIASILSPMVPTCDLDSVDITVAVQNLGSDTLHNCSIYYQINTSTPVAMYYTGSVAPQGGQDTVTIANESFSNGDDLTIW
ncbi:GEVED domain-containing protein, partial [Salibacteraceae bacterium]|nr:GEVED domain-containing protein [Salibacteraceae bacterium]